MNEKKKHIFSRENTKIPTHTFFTAILHFTKYDNNVK